MKNREAFSLHKFDIAVTNQIEMDILLKPEAEPKMQKYIPIPHNVKDKAKEILDQFLEHGVIRICDEPSPYCSNILVIKKKEAGSIRLLFDGRLLNYDTVRLPQALISKPEIMAHLVGKKHLTSLDFADAFYHIPLSKKAQPLTAFYAHTHGLRMCFTRAPQGLRNSPLYLKLLTDRIFRDMTDSVLFYADDLLVATDGTLEEHMLTVEKVLEKLVQSGLKLRPKKLLIARQDINFLGMTFKKDIINIPEAKMLAFKQFPSPNTPKKVKSLLCCLSFYRHFCPKFAELSHELMQLSTLHAKQFKWEDKHEKQLRLLIDTICTNATLYIPDPNKTFYVQTDASQFCAAGRIFQKDDQDREKVIASVSRTFTKTEQHYSIFKKEILALLYTLKSMDYFLRFANHLVIYVDAKSIIYLRLAKDSSGILLRFSVELSNYEAEIFHVPGEENVVSDVLSRQNDKIEQIKQDIEENQTMSEKDTITLIKKLTLPQNFNFTKDELKNMLEGPSPPATTNKKTAKSKALTGKRKIKNTPNTLNNKKVNLPKTSTKRPGMKLPLCILTRAMQKEELRSILKKYTPKRNNKRRTSISFNENTEVKEFNKSDTVNTINEFTSESENDTDSEMETDSEDQTQHISKTGQSKDIDSGFDSYPEPDYTQQGTITEKDMDIDYGANEDLSDMETDNGANSESNAEYGANNYQDNTDIQNDTNNEQENIIEYTDVKTICDIITDGSFTIQMFKQAQIQDKFCSIYLKELKILPPKFVINDNILFYKQKGKPLKPVLPEILYETIIFSKHFNIFGNHQSLTRLKLNIKNNYYIREPMFSDKLRKICKNCFICQIFATDTTQHEVKQLPRINSPRISWSIDLITDTPTSNRNNTLILLCVCDFSSYVVSIPIPSASSKDIVYALKTQLFAQFGIPKYIRSDQQASLYNSSYFYDKLTELGIELQATAVAAPFSNSRAESQIKNIKHAMRKTLYQEHTIIDWDEYISIITYSHNNSINTYGCTPEELMFGIKLNNTTDILTFTNNISTPEEYTKYIFEKAANIRKKAKQNMDLKALRNRTFKNQNRILKTFKIGDLVLHKQLQASTGIASKYKPLFTGPYTVIKLNADECTAVLEHVQTQKLIKAHFTNIQDLNFSIHDKLSDNFDKQLIEQLSNIKI